MAGTDTGLSIDKKIRLIRDLYGAFGRGDVAAIDAAMADDVRWHFPGTGPFGADVKGKSAVMSQLGLPMQHFEEFKLEVHDVLGSGDHIVALVSSNFRRKGRNFHDREAHVFHISADGKVAEVWFTLDTEQMKAAMES